MIILFTPGPKPEETPQMTLKRPGYISTKYLNSAMRIMWSGYGIPGIRDNMEHYFPGNEYVDWIGITGLNYGVYNNDKQWHSFQSLYSPFHEEIKNSQTNQ